MTTNQQLLSLIEKLEKAEKPTSEHTALIALAIDYPVETVNGMNLAEAYKRYPTDHSGIVRAFELPYWPFFLDAALKLIPEGYAWNINFSSGTYTALTYDPNKSIEYDQGGQNMANPALALCIAALRARLAMMEGKGE